MKTMRAARVICWVVTAIAGGPAAHAQDTAIVRGMAATCANCHGTEGRSVSTVPGLAGTDKVYFTQQMKDFKAGTRPATIMHQIAKGYSDGQIDQLAGYFSALRK